MKSQVANFQTNKNKSYDLEDRTRKLCENIIDLLKRIPENFLNRRIIEQLVGSSGSIGANYCEANESESRKDFMHKISICKKETRETRHWIRLFIRVHPEFTKELETLEQETQELLLIFSSIIHTMKKAQLDN